MNRNFARPTIMEDEILAARRKMKSGKPIGPDSTPLEIPGDYGINKIAALL